jgi:tetratricopeptide (TPR) repeat protein
MVRFAAVAMTTADELYQHGCALKARGDVDAARREFEGALALDAGHAGACLQLGNLLFAREPERGLAMFERAFEIDPAYPGVARCLTLGYLAIGTIAADLEHWQEMFAAYERALAVDPHHAATHFNLATELLRQGRLLEGWREYEWRWQWKDFGDRPRNFSQPLWQGKPLDGARILLHGEQGMGDVIQFARYAPLVSERGGRVVLEVYPPLGRLLAQLPGVESVIARGDALPPFEWQCPLMSLPLAFGTTLETIPARAPYLSAQPAALDPPSRPAVPAERRIGLVWTGSRAHLTNARRSVPLALMAPLTRMEGTRWYSLQNEPDESLAQVGASLVNLESRLGDFADTASLVASLDLVVTVDTSMAHLAGALGKPVWILLSKPSDWRWLLDRNDSPWYPTARLFRQRTRGGWPGVIDEVRRALLTL